MDKENNPAPKNDSGDKGQEDKPTTFTQEQVNDVVSKRLAEANTKARKLKDEVLKALAKAERQSKLSEAERGKEFKAKQQKELDDRERTITVNAEPMLKMHCLIEISTQTSETSLLILMRTKPMPISIS